MTELVDVVLGGTFHAAVLFLVADQIIRIVVAFVLGMGS